MTRLGARAEYHFMPTPPRTGAEQWANADPELERFLHLWAMNRGILMTPFHNMALMSPGDHRRRRRSPHRGLRRGGRGALRVTGAGREAVPGVRLRDVTLDDADLLDAWNADPSASGAFNDFGGSPKLVDREALARGPLRNERNGQLIVERVADGKPIGTVGWHAVGYGPNPRVRAWNVGHRAAARRPRPRLRHGGPGLLAGVPLREHRVNRIEAQTDVDNIAEQRSLEKAGFVREGDARGSQFRAGAYHDLVTYSILRGDT